MMGMGCVTVGFPDTAILGSAAAALAHRVSDDMMRKGKVKKDF